MSKRLRIKKRYLLCVLFILFGISVTGKDFPVGADGVEKGMAELVAGQAGDFIMPISRGCGLEETGEKGMEKQNLLLKEFPIMVQAMPVSDLNKQENEPENILAGMLAENEMGKNPEEKEEKVFEGVTDVMSGQQFENVSADKKEEFNKAIKTNSYDFAALSEYQTFVSTFYTIDAGTTAGSNELNLEKLLSKDMRISKEDPGPQILIYHTHSLEAFADSIPGERSHTIVGMGDRLAEILTRDYGYEVLHHTEEYDTVRGDAYANSLPGIKKVLEENPSIQVVIDLHRDAGVTGVKRSITLDGKPTATFMLFNGLSRTRKTGNIDYLYNPYLEDNLAFSFQMQMKAGEYYPGLTRKIYLKAYRYNMHLIPKTLLIELGDSNNTVEEAENTCYPLAHILDMVLSGEG